MEIFSGVGLKRGGGGSVTLSSEILARAANMFPNTSTEGKIFPILVLLLWTTEEGFVGNGGKAGVQTRLVGRVSS